MSIYAVRDNLKNTIAGKERHLAAMRTQTESLLSAWYAMVGMLEINIDELKRILVDVEECCIEHNEMSWALNPERMGQ